MSTTGCQGDMLPFTWTYITQSSWMRLLRLIVNVLYFRQKFKFTPVGATHKDFKVQMVLGWTSLRTLSRDDWDLEDLSGKCSQQSPISFHSLTDCCIPSTAVEWTPKYEQTLNQTHVLHLHNTFFMRRKWFCNWRTPLRPTWFFPPLERWKQVVRFTNTIAKMIKLEVEMMTATKIWLHFELGHHSIAMVWYTD